MKNILTKEITRRRSFLIFCAGVLLFPVGYQIYGMLWGWSGFLNLFSVIEYWFYLCAVLTVAVYICLSSSLLEDVDEAIAGCRGKGYYQRKGLGCFLAILIFSQMIVFLMMEFVVIRNDATDYALSVLPKMFVCNLFLPLLICLLVGCVLAQWQNQHHSAIVLLIFLVMSSPVTEMMFGNGENADSLGNRIGYAIRHSFGIFYEETIWWPNEQIGLQTEWIRFAVQFFWILLCLGMLCLMKKRKVCVSGCLLLACSIACLTYAQLPASTSRHYNSNEDYYLYKEQAIGMQEAADIGYSIQDYDLTLNFGRQLDVTGTLILQAEGPTDEFILTLYRGYKIKSIDSAEPITWSVQDDLVTIRTKKLTKDLKLELHYAGYHNLFYSNMDGAMLPGWFPWYPMAGEKQIYLNFETWTSEYNTYNRIEPAHIQLAVQAPFTLVSNLTQMSEQVYEGESDSITVIGGYIAKTDDPMIANILPLNLSVTEEQKVEQLKDSYQSVCDEMEAYGLDQTLISDRKIIVASADLSCNGTGGDVAIFSDYILTDEGNLGAFSTFTKVLIMERNKSELSVLIGGMGLNDTPEQTLESWSFFSDIPREELTDAQLQLVDLLDAAQDAGKEDQLVQEIAAFLISEHEEADEEIFWKELRERYGTS
ncbi:MAG: hypothetical protein LUE11_09145 [Clostridia bacterium]|nr:hypothetical protein [Clostridia bacterium]